jgi:hypothetical protein
MVESTEEQTESLMKPFTRFQDLARRPSTISSAAVR